MTALNSAIGYEAASKVAKQSLAEKKTVRQVVIDRGHVADGKLTEQQLDEALDVLRAAYPGREVVGVDARPLYARGGGIHCITQQQPAT